MSIYFAERKIIHESTGAAETYLAHQLPDQYNAIATPVVKTFGQSVGSTPMLLEHKIAVVTGVVLSVDGLASV